MTADSDRQRRQVGELVERVVEADFGEGDSRERQALRRYVSADPARAMLHDDLLQLWDELGRLGRSGFQPSIAVEAPRTPWWRRRSLAVAAAILPILLAAGAMLLWVDSSRPARYAADIRAGAAERRLVNLPDGSTVSLSAASEVAVDLGRSARNLELRQGEALFSVAHDPARPFVVHVQGGEIRAIGTSFNVRVEDQQVTVTVVEGTVQIETEAERSSDAGLVQLATAGQQVVFGRRRQGSEAQAEVQFMAPPRRVDSSRYASWAEGVLRFDGEPLSEVIKEVNRYSSRDLRLGDPKLASLPIYGELHIGDIEGLRSIVADIEQVDSAAIERKLPTVSNGDR